VLHPVRSANATVSLRLQAGNADDALMRALHGRDWRRDAGAPRGRFRRHLLIVAAALGTAGFSLRGRPSTAALAAAGWLAGGIELASARIRAGPGTPGEVAKMLATSLPMPFYAVGYRVAGCARVARLARVGGCAALATGAPATPLTPAPTTLCTHAPPTLSR
jgi:hypothetical protein